MASRSVIRIQNLESNRNFYFPNKNVILSGPHENRNELVCMSAQTSANVTSVCVRNTRRIIQASFRSSRLVLYLQTIIGKTVSCRPTCCSPRLYPFCNSSPVHFRVVDDLTSSRRHNHGLQIIELVSATADDDPCWVTVTMHGIYAKGTSIYQAFGTFTICNEGTPFNRTNR